MQRRRVREAVKASRLSIGWVGTGQWCTPPGSALLSSATQPRTRSVCRCADNATRKSGQESHTGVRARQAALDKRRRHRPVVRCGVHGRCTPPAGFPTRAHCSPGGLASSRWGYVARQACIPLTMTPCVSGWVRLCTHPAASPQAHQHHQPRAAGHSYAPTMALCGTGRQACVRH